MMNREQEDTVASLETQIASLQRLVEEIEANNTPSTEPNDGECLKTLKLNLLKELILRAKAKLELLTK